MSKIPSDSQTEAIRPIHRIFHTSQSDIVRLGRRIGTGDDFSEMIFFINSPNLQ